MQEPQLPTDPVERLDALRAIAAKVLAHAESKAMPALASSQAATLPSGASEPPVATPSPIPGTGNAAVDRCLAAFRQTYGKRREAGASDFDATTAAKEAYRRAMPPLVGPQNIADFIACVTRAILENLIFRPDIMQLLYAAQVANSVKNATTFPSPKRPRGRPSSVNASLPEASESVDSPVNSEAQS